MTEAENPLSPETIAWLDERRRAGRWFAIAPDDELPSDIPGWEVTILHMFQIAFTPEIERRRAAGLLDDDFVLGSAQLVQPPGRTSVVRFNDEVRGMPLIRIDRPVEKGEPVFLDDLKNLVSFDVEEDEIDCGHFTIIWNGSGWAMFFDFRSGRGKAAQMIELAKQFLAAARFSVEHGHAGPAVDNLFSACELLSKAHLTLHQSRAVESKSHGAVSAALNAWGRLGNIDGDFVRIFNRMSNLRASARYKVEFVEQPSNDDLDLVDRELQILDAAVALRTRERIEREQSGQ